MQPKRLAGRLVPNSRLYPTSSRTPAGRLWRLWNRTAHPNGTGDTCNSVSSRWSWPQQPQSSFGVETLTPPGVSDARLTTDHQHGTRTATDAVEEAAERLALP